MDLTNLNTRFLSISSIGFLLSARAWQQQYASCIVCPIMFGRKIAIVAILLYAVVMGCVLSSPESTSGSSAAAAAGKSATQAPVTGLVHVANQRPFCGVSIRLQRVDWVEEYKKTIDDIAADGADTVQLIVDARQENAESTEMYVDMRKTMTVPQLTDIILHAKSKGLRVIVM